jgi:hypothetical protein
MTATNTGIAVAYTTSLLVFFPPPLPPSTLTLAVVVPTACDCV